MPSGVYKHLKHTNPNCQCCSCKSKRGEHLNRVYTHKTDCQCCSCKSKRDGTHHSKETCRKISIGNTGKHPSEETKRKNSESNKGREFTEEHIRNLCIANKKNWQNPEYREKTLKAMFKGLDIKPNKPEQLLNKLLQTLFPNQYKYVGDGSVLIGYKNPDFINVNGQKKIIELFGDYFHSEKVTGIPVEQHVRERIGHFAKYGYQTLIIWEYELKDMNKLMQKIRNFNIC